VKSESRESDRFAHQSPVTREDIQTGIHSGAKMYNYSKDGLYFEADYLLQADDEIFIGIENSPYASTPSVYECCRARVVWRKDLGDRGPYLYGYGIQFYYPNYICPPIIGEDASAQTATERPTPRRRKYSREYPRRSYTKKIIFSTQDRFYEGFMKNISRKGIFIETYQTFTVGQQISLVVPLGNKKKGIKLKGKVIWSSRDGFGLEFIAEKKN